MDVGPAFVVITVIAFFIGLHDVLSESTMANEADRIIEACTATEANERAAVGE